MSSEVGGVKPGGVSGGRLSAGEYERLTSSKLTRCGDDFSWLGKVEIGRGEVMGEDSVKRVFCNGGSICEESLTGGTQCWQEGRMSG